MGREILTQKQAEFLEVVANSPDLCAKFYLTGGTALAAFYLNHRESEDLDFFSQDEIEPLAVETFLKTNKPRIGFERFEFQKSFNRNLFFLHFPEGKTLKTEFTFFPFSPVERGMAAGALRIDSVRDIAVNKVFTISQQTRARDFVDLYFIMQKEGWTLHDLLKDARIKFDTHIDLVQFGAQLLQAYDLKDLPRMRVPLDRAALRSFFLAEAESLGKHILS